YYHYFNNYYAYDDGTAEMGFGLTGNGSANSLFAVEFTTFKEDTLGGVYIYFLKYNTSENLTFDITLWDADNGKPGNILYSKPGCQPEFSDDRFDFVYYSFDTTLIVANTFYVGIIQISEELLNIGWDINTNSQLRNFKHIINTQGESEWINFSNKGTLMIRPYFGKIIEPTSINNIIKDNFEINVYPNPVTNILYIKPINYINIKNIRVKIFNIDGKQIYSYDNVPEYIDFSKNDQGVYIIQFTDNLHFNSYKKVMVIR
ncbi:MAG: T9SS type A sorting domain-containing protein, partial [Bacteroidales bacterium]|nr:T9SS type A sorting domain-containing protein [Bacteroidales bacterium]